MDTINTHVYDRSLSWFGTGNAIKSYFIFDSKVISNITNYVSCLLLLFIDIVIVIVIVIVITRNTGQI